jgi:hypothetical protein
MATSRPTRSRRRVRLVLLTGVVAGLLGALLAVPPAGHPTEAYVGVH